MEAKGKSKYAVSGLAIMLLISLIGNGIFISKNHGLEADRNKAVLAADSTLAVKMLLDKECDDTKAKLAQIQGKNAELDRSIQSLNNNLDAMKLQSEKLLKENASVNSLRKQLSEAKNLRKSCEEQVNSLLNENSSLDATIKELNSSNVFLQNQLNELSSKLEKARELKAFNFSTAAYKLKKSRTVPTVKARKTNRIAITFELIDNPVAEHGTKTAYVVITDPKGESVIMQAGKFFNKKSGKEVFYSSKKEFDFNNSEQRLTLNFDYDNKLKNGKYKAEVYIDGSYSGRTDFILK